MRKLFFVVISCLFLFGNDKIDVLLSWKYQFEFAGFIVAKEKGFYKEVGLDVNLKELNDTSSIVNWVLSNKNSYAVANSAILETIMQHKPIELLMPIYDNSLLVLTAVDLNITSLKDIKNYHLIVDQFTLQDPAILGMLNSQNISIKKLRVIQKTIYDIQNPAIYALYESNKIYDLKYRHIKYKIFDPKEYGFDFYGDILFTSKDEVKNHPQRVQKFIEATKKGYIYAFNHINETIKIIKKYNPNLDDKKLLYEAHKLKQYLSKTFKFDLNKLKIMETIYITLGIVKKPINIEEYIFNPYKLTMKEKLFLKTHFIKALSTDTWEPFNLLQDGKLDGIAVEYWKYIKDKAGIRGRCMVVTDWSSILNYIKTKKADVTCSTTLTPDREKYAIFSKPYVSFPIVIATRNNVGFISDLNILKGKIIAVGKNYTVAKLLKTYYPHLKILEVKNTDEALRLVSEKKVFGAVDILPVIAYKINKYEYANLKIAGRTKLMFDVRFMVRKDYPELVAIINKMIDSMPKEKREEIYKKWISVKYQKGYSEKYVFNIILLTLIVFIVIMIVIVYLVRNILYRDKLEKELEILATMDRLTSIFNRYKIDMALNEQTQIAKRYKRPLSIIFLDIDHFKKINDLYGHQVGDYILVELSKLISAHIRSSDIFGRWGGEEFLIILPETPLDKATKLAEKLRKLIENHDFKKVPKVTCSFGVTSFHDDTPESIIKRVDALLYKSKENGRNKVTIG